MSSFTPRSQSEPFHLRCDPALHGGTGGAATTKRIAYKGSKMIASLIHRPLHRKDFHDVSDGVVRGDKGAEIATRVCRVACRLVTCIMRPGKTKVV